MLSAYVKTEKSGADLTPSRRSFRVRAAHAAAQLPAGSIQPQVHAAYAGTACTHGAPHETHLRSPTETSTQRFELTPRGRRQRTAESAIHELA